VTSKRYRERSRSCSVFQSGLPFSRMRVKKVSVQYLVQRETWEGPRRRFRWNVFPRPIAALTGSIFELAELHNRIHFQCYGKRPAWFVSELDPHSTDVNQVDCLPKKAPKSGSIVDSHQSVVLIKIGKNMDLFIVCFVSTKT